MSATEGSQLHLSQPGPRLALFCLTPKANARCSGPASTGRSIVRKLSGILNTAPLQGEMEDCILIYRRTLISRPTLGIHLSDKFVEVYA
jgi:hypothetical protein